MRHPFVRVFRVVGLLTLAVLLFLGGAYGYVHGGGNFHEVEKGVIYRSSWLGADGLEKAIDRYGVKSVLNLCGAQPGDAWYDGETKVARQHGIVFRSLALSANTELDVKQVADLVEALREAPKPLLIHCRAGSDRTGLACAIYVASHGGSYRDAREQLSLYYGHFPYFGSKSVAMDVTLERFYESVAGRRVAGQAGAR
ncbi:MAG: tyrosine-protein phosphatase [Verrucomicrobiota bacterium]